MKKTDLNSYALTRAWFDFLLDNPEKVTASHGMLYLWLVEINNRCGWREKFQITARECMDGMACKSRTTYTKCLQDLIDWGFVTVVLKSTNQWQCNVVCLSKKCTTTSASTSTTTGQPLVQSLDNHVDYSKTIETNKIINNTPISPEGIVDEGKNSLEENKAKREKSSSKKEEKNIEDRKEKRFDNPDLEEIFKDFVTMRNKIKKPLTDKAEKLLIAKLKKLSKYNSVQAIQILEQSIINCWQDVYELKSESKKDARTPEQIKYQPNRHVYETN